MLNGLLTHGVAESAMFAPPRLCEYLGLALDFGERVDLGGATSAGMVWRAAAAVELGVCDAVLAVVPGSRIVPQSQQRPAARARIGMGRRRTTMGRRRPSSRSRTATWARTRRTRRSLSVTRRSSATTPPPSPRSRSTNAPTRARIRARFSTAAPITVDDVLASPMIADPIHMLETVMRVHGGVGVLIANADIARRSRHRPVWIKGLR